jgi:acid phosphatase
MPQIFGNSKRMRRFALLSLSAALGTAATLVACSNNNHDDDTPDAAAVTAALQAQVKNIVVIYAENRSFDNLYGTFPGANGIPGVDASAVGSYVSQTDRDAASTVLGTLPAVWGGLTAAGQYPVVTQADTTNKLANKPFRIDESFPVDESVVTRDLYHRFYENQMQIGTTGARDNSKFAAVADSGGLVMGYYDGSRMALWNIAKDYVLADNFFQGAFGGSFLNHQYLVCACAPSYPNADTAAAKPTITVLDTDASGAYLPTLKLAVCSPASALDGPPSFVTSGNIAPKDYFGAGDGFRAVNTMQPPYQPSSNAPASDDASKLYADTSKPNTLPPQTQTHIGDLLTAKSVSWAWYAGSWDSTLATATGDRAAISANPPNFQFHHQPFNYYAEFDPATHAADRDAHLKDYKDLVADAAAGTLPAVAFYKPQGNQNQHAGYANVADGDAHIADVVQRLQASPQWPNMVIVITYDENGGFWDHVSPPKGDLLGPGTRIPALIVSPLAKKGTVDHTQYDTASILRLITRRFALDALPGLTARDAALTAAGGKAMGDLTPALDLK